MIDFLPTNSAFAIDITVFLKHWFKNVKCKNSITQNDRQSLFTRQYILTGFPWGGGILLYMAYTGGDVPLDRVRVLIWFARRSGFQTLSGSPMPKYWSSTPPLPHPRAGCTCPSLYRLNRAREIMSECTHWPILKKRNHFVKSWKNLLYAWKHYRRFQLSAQMIW